MASVTFDHVTKRFGDVVALNDLTIHVQDKEFLVLVGPSGCGKTTALRCLAGLEDVTEGRILIDDQVVNDVLAKDRDIAMVFQSYALYPHMTVYDNMAFGLKMRKVPKDEIKRRVHEAAEILGIEDLLDRRPNQLSGGQRQRVAVGRTIVRNPKVFLFDEPLSNLDAKLRVQTRAEISKLHKRLQTTFIYVTHDQVEAMTLGRRVAVLDQGVLQQVDAPLALYDRPANTFVARFLGSPGMNVFPVAWDADRQCLRVGPQSLPLPAHARARFQAAGEAARPCLAGLRPEALTVPGTSAQRTTTAGLEVQVTGTESIGHERLVYGRLPEITLDAAAGASDQLVARVPVHRSVDMGQRLVLHFDPARLYLFDCSGRTIVAPEPTP